MVSQLFVRENLLLCRNVFDLLFHLESMPKKKLEVKQLTCLGCSYKWYPRVINGKVKIPATRIIEESMTGITSLFIDLYAKMTVKRLCYNFSCIRQCKKAWIILWTNNMHLKNRSLVLVGNGNEKVIIADFELSKKLKI